LFVVSIESLQQQGIELTPEISGIVPKLLDEIDELVQTIAQRAA
jgi:hypothetical protein